MGLKIKHKSKRKYLVALILCIIVMCAVIFNKENAQKLYKAMGLSNLNENETVSQNYVENTNKDIADNSTYNLTRSLSSENSTVSGETGMQESAGSIVELTYNGEIIVPMENPDNLEEKYNGQYVINIEPLQEKVAIKIKADDTAKIKVGSDYKDAVMEITKNVASLTKDLEMDVTVIAENEEESVYKLIIHKSTQLVGKVITDGIYSNIKIKLYNEANELVTTGIENDELVCVEVIPGIKYKVEIEKSGYLKHTLTGFEPVYGTRNYFGEIRLLAGDVRGQENIPDGRVDLKDLVATNIKARIKSVVDDTNSMYDFNGDGIIDDKDVKILSTNYNIEAIEEKYEAKEEEILAPEIQEYNAEVKEEKIILTATVKDYKLDKVYFNINGEKVEGTVNFNKVSAIYNYEMRFNEELILIVEATNTANKKTISEEKTITGNIIKTAEDLNLFSSLVNDRKNYDGETVKLGNDINMAGIEFAPIGKTNTIAFKGTFDGCGHTISNISINSQESYIGLFGATNGATIKNVRIANGNFASEKNNVAGLIGYSRTTIIDNCHITATVRGKENVGGIVGNNIDTTITNCYSNGSVTGNAKVGGIAGNFSRNSYIENSYSIAEVTGTSDAGKVVGYINPLRKGQISNSYYNAGEVRGIGTQEENDEKYQVYEITNNEELLENLGEAYKADYYWNINEGYPILKWEPKAHPKLTTILIDANSGEYAKDKIVEQSAGTSIDLSEPIKEYYDFTGWEIEVGNGTIEGNTYTYGTEDTLIKATWSPTVYNIEYDLAGGIVAGENPQTFTIESEDITLINPTREYTIKYDVKGGNYLDEVTVPYTFLGWFTEKKEGEKIENIKIPTEDKTVYAHWKENSTELPDAVREGYTFKGWYLDEEYTNKIENTTNYIPTEDTTVYAKWEANTYIVTYEYNGATANNTVATKEVVYDSVYGKLEEPEKTYTVTYNTNGGTALDSVQASETFKGWHKTTNYNNEVTKETIVKTADDHTIYAKWDEVNITLGQTSREGYTFEGWYEKELTGKKAGNIEDTYKVTEDITLVAKWTLNEYTIEYDLAGGTVDGTNPTQYTVESEDITLINPTREGYTFAGWTITDLDKATMEVTIPTGSIGDKEYTATWEVIEYTIEYDLAGGTVDGTNPTTYTIESEDITLINPTREGYTFAGWTGTDIGTRQDVTITSGSTGDRSYTATWKTIKYTISYDLAEGRVSGNPTQYTIESEDITLINPTKTGYTFAGWTGTDLNESTMEITIPTGSIGDRSYIATWTINRYTLTYEANGGTVVPKTTSADYGTSITMPTPIRKYTITFDTKAEDAVAVADITVAYEFKGWYNSTEGTVEQIYTTMPAEDKTLYAKWTKVGTELPETSREGYTFAGWYRDEEYTNKITTTTFIPTEDTTVYAKWTSNEYTLTYEYNGATLRGDDTKQVFYHSPYGELFTPKKEYTVIYDANGGTDVDEENVEETFEGWYKESSFVNEITEETIVQTSKNHTIYAKWRKVSIRLGETTRQGYTFGGWYKNSVSTGSRVGYAGDEYEVTSDVTLVAKWTVNKYTLSYELDGGRVTSNPSQYTIESEAITLNNPTKTGYTFTGWTGTDLTEATMEVTIPSGSIGDRSYTATWTINHYTVEFNTYGGNSINSQSIEYLGTATRPEDPQREYYEFQGWFVGANEYDFLTPITSDLIITAKWKAEEFEITYDLDGGSVTENPDKYTIESEAITLNNPTKTGYTFSGWMGTGLQEAIKTVIIPKGSTGIKAYVATWTEIEYTISYNLDGGTTEPENPITYTIESEDITLNNPTRTGYTFAGWTGTGLSVATEEVTIISGSTGNRNYTATWTINKYTVTFNTYGGNDVSEQTINYNAKATRPADPTKTGYTFNGWYLDGYEYNFNTPITGDITLVAHWDVAVYSVKFNTDGGTSVTTQNVNYNETATKPEDPTKTGYSFEGWYIGDNKFDFSTPIISDITLVAHWDKGRYTVTFDTDGGNSIEPIFVNYNETIKNPATPVKEGCVFVGWYVGDNSFNFSTPITDNITIVAHWNVLRLTVKFNSNGGTTVDSQIVNYNETVVKPEDPTKTGYTFDGWYLETTLYNFENLVKEDITLQAHWLANEYDVTYNYNNATDGDDASGLRVTYDSPYANLISTPKKAYTVTFVTNGGPDIQEKAIEYKLRGWYTDSELTSTSAVTNQNRVAIANNHTLYANYSDVEYIELPQIERAGYEFAGWYSDISLAESSKITTTRFKPTSDTILYAKWNLVTYTIDYVLSGGTVDGTNPVTYNVNTPTFTLINPTLDEAEFLGWRQKNVDTPELDITIETGSTGDRNYSAVWQIKEYTVTFETNGGDLATTIKRAYKNGQVELPTSSNITKTGYTFDGWYEAPELDVESEITTLTYKVTGDTTLYAKWTPIEYTITYNLGAVDVELENENPTTYTVETDNFTLSNPIREQYAFLGWTGTGLSGVTKNVTIEKGTTGDKTYTASWEEVDGTVYALLYDDGTLTFARTNDAIEGRTLVATYGPLEAMTAETQPWKDQTITKVEILERIYPESTAYWFDGCSSLTQIDGIENIRTITTTDMNHTFSGCSNLQTLDLSTFNTEDTTDMSYMFYNAENLSTIKISSKWVIDKADISLMFDGCGTQIATMDIYAVLYTDGTLVLSGSSDIDEEKEVSVNYGNITGSELEQPWMLKVSNIRTVEIADLIYPNTTAHWFENCSNLTEIINIENLNTTYTTDMSYMFANCLGISSIDLSKFDTTNVTNTTSMFGDAENLETIKIGAKWTVSDEDIANMFGEIERPSIVDGKVYAVLYDDGTLTLSSKDTIDETKTVVENYGDIGETIFTEASDQPWAGNRATITKVVIDPVNKISPISTSFWFYGLNNLTEIENIENLDTTYVISMYSMFYNCSNLTTLDLSTFNTSNVTDMGYMFFNCSNLETLNISNFNTVKVTNMGNMFSGCNKLTILNLDSFDTSNVTDMRNMFYNDSALTSINISDNWTFNKVTNLTDIFKNSGATLFDIYVKYYSNGTLVFSRTNTTLEGLGTVTDYGNIKGENYSSSPAWYAKRGSVTKVIINEKIFPTSTAYWFYIYTALNQIEGLTKLETSQTTNMAYMFYRCSALTSLDLSSFNTSNVTNMQYMFYQCEALANLNLANFNTEKVTNMSYMFRECKALTSLDLSSFNTSNVTDMQYMFYYCNKMLSLDLSNFDTAKVTNMERMFYECSKLTKLDLTSFNTKKVDYMTYMFGYCSALKTILVSMTNWKTASNNSNMFSSCGVSDVTYCEEWDKDTFVKLYKDGTMVFSSTDELASGKELQVDYGNIAGQKFNNKTQPWRNEISSIKKVEIANKITPIHTTYWFYNLQNVTEIINLNNLNTNNVTDMSYMFYYCVRLTNLDLDNFNTSNVTNMDYMFYDCDIITSLDLKSFDTSKVTTMKNMFAYSYKLNLVLVSSKWKTASENSNWFNSCIAKDVTYAADWGYNTYVKYYTDGTLVFSSTDTLVSGKTLYKDYGNIIGRTFTEVTLPWKSESGSLTKVMFLDNIVPRYTTYWFYNCTYLREIVGIENLDTSNVLDMQYMFYKCSSLTYLDLRGFDTNKVTNMMYMFSNCTRLSAIHVSTKWKTPSTNTTNMLYSCIATELLVDNNWNNATYVKYYDDGTLAFSSTNTLISGKTLSKDYGNIAGETFKYNTQPWKNEQSSIKKVVIVDKIKPINTAYWFYACGNLKEIVNIENIDVSEVNSMQSMFNSCRALVSLDLRSFDTAKVTNMQELFYYCDSLTVAYGSSKWKQPSSSSAISNMFYYASISKVTIAEEGYEDIYAKLYDSYTLVFTKTDRLVSGKTLTKNYGNIAGQTFDASTRPWANDTIKYVQFEDEITPINTTYWFRGNTNLISVTNIEKLNITTMKELFYGCTALRTIDLSKFNASEVTDMSYLFYNCTNLNTITFGNINTSNVTDMSYMFFYCNALTSLDVSTLNTSKVTTMRNMFYYCSGLKSLYVGNFDTSNVTNMYGMFDHCSTLKNLDLRNFDTSNVTNMSCMFYYCSELTVVYGSAKWKNASTRDSMFSGAIATKVTIGQDGYENIYAKLYYNNSNYTLVFTSTDRLVSGRTLYKDYGNIAGQTFDSSTRPWKNDTVHYVCFEDKIKPINTTYWFRDNTNIKGILNIENLSLTSMKELFYGCTSLISVDLSNFDASKITDMSYMFYGCTGLTTVTFGNIDTSNVTDMSYMFYNCKALTSLDVSTLNTSKVTTMRNMFCYCSELKSLYVGNFDTSNVLTMYSMFDHCSTLKNLDLRNFDTAKVTNMSYMFYYCSELTVVYGSAKWKNASTRDSMFSGAIATKVTIGQDGYENIYAKLYYNSSNYTLVFTSTDRLVSGRTLYKDYGNIAGQTFDSSTRPWKNDTVHYVCFEDKIKPINITYWFRDNTNIKGIINIENLSLTSFKEMFYGCTSLTSVDLSNYDVSKITDMSYMFYGCTGLTTVTFGNIDTSNVTDMSYMFRGCYNSNFKTIDLSKFNTSKVTNMEYMFNGCSYLKTIDVSNFDTSNVENMRYMFYDCDAITYLDLRNFDTTNVTNMNYMFYDTANLRAIHVSSKWKTPSSNASSMFYSYALEALVSQEGYEDIFVKYYTDKTLAFSSTDTTITGKKVSIDYGNISGETFKSNTVPWRNETVSYITIIDKITPINTTYWFRATGVISITNIENLNLTSFKELFYGCTSLQSINLSNYDVSKITDMSYMFYGCSALRTVTFGNIDTSNVTDMSYMFYDCDNSNFTTIDLSKFNTSKVTNMEYMFYYCRYLKNLDLSSFDTSNVENMRFMFYDCDAITYLDLRNFDTAKVTNMNYIFYDADKLYAIHVSSKWKTPSTNASSMFYKVSGVLLSEEGYADLYARYYSDKTLIFSSTDVYDTSKTLSYDFGNISGETFTNNSLPWKDCTVYYAQFYNIVTPKNVENWFKNNSSLRSVSNIGNLNVTNTKELFYGCSYLTSIDLSSFNASNVTDMSYMFYECTKLTSITWENIDTSNVENMSYMFYGCNKFTGLDLSKFNTSNVTNMSNMFNGCSKLDTLNVSSFDTTKVTNMDFMFASCSYLTSLDLTSFTVTSSTNTNYMFYYCSKLATITVSSTKWQKEISTSANTFDSCKTKVLTYQ